MHRFLALLLVIMAEAMFGAPRAEAKKPEPPTELRAEKSAQLAGAVELSWHAVKGAAEYKISASRENTDNWQDLGATTATSFQVNELPEATKYYFRVASKANSGQSGWSVAVMQISSGKKHM